MGFSFEALKTSHESFVQQHCLLVDLKNTQQILNPSHLLKQPLTTQKQQLLKYKQTICKILLNYGGHYGIPFFRKSCNYSSEAKTDKILKFRDI